MTFTWAPVSILNCILSPVSILHNMTQEKRMSQLEFTIALIKELTVDIPSLRPPSHYRVQEVSLNAYRNFPSSNLQTGKKANPTRNCTVCTFVKKRKQGRVLSRAMSTKNVVAFHFASSQVLLCVTCTLSIKGGVANF